MDRHTEKLFEAAKDLSSMAAEVSLLKSFKQDGLGLNQELTGVFEIQRIEALKSVNEARESLAKASRALSGLGVCFWLNEKGDAEGGE